MIGSNAENLQRGSHQPGLPVHAIGGTPEVAQARIASGEQIVHGAIIIGRIEQVDAPFCWVEGRLRKVIGAFHENHSYSLSLAVL